MSTLIVLCPCCLTWIGTGVDSCGECGMAVNPNDPDPARSVLEERLGNWLRKLGSVKISRRGWPDHGNLLATTTGLLFVPAFDLHPNGALEAHAEHPPSGSPRVATLFHWWSLPPGRRPVEGAAVRSEPGLPTAAPLDVLFNSPGAVFVPRIGIRRCSFRWGRVQIERPPSRTVVLLPLPNEPSPRDLLRELLDQPEWRTPLADL